MCARIIMAKRKSRKRSKRRSSIPKHYTGKLSRKDKKSQLKELKKSQRDYKEGKYHSRKKMKSFKSKKSGWTQQFKKKYPEAKTLLEISKATKIPKGALSAVKKKGMGAYFSSGSRPNQTAESWGLARMYSYILGGPTRRVDHHITQKYKVKFRVKPNNYSYQAE